MIWNLLWVCWQWEVQRTEVKGISFAGRRGIIFPDNWSTTGLVKDTLRILHRLLDLTIVLNASSKKHHVTGVLFLTSLVLFQMLESSGCTLPLFAQERPLLRSSEAIANFCVLWHSLLFCSPSRGENRIHSLSVFLLVRKIPGIYNQSRPTEMGMRAHFKCLSHKGANEKATR